jgi:hypothetical protein
MAPAWRHELVRCVCGTVTKVIRNMRAIRHIHVNIIFEYFSENMSRKFKFHSNLTRIMATLHEDQQRFWHGYVLREEGTHCILLIAHIALCKSCLTPAHCISLIVYLTSYTLQLTSYILHLTSYILHLTSYILHLTSYTLHLMPYVLHLTPYVLHLTPYVLRLTSYILYHIVSYSVPCDMYTSCV